MALTPAETFEHIGRMVKHGMNNIAVPGENKLRFLMAYGKDYVANGTHGTQAERAEAMVAAKESVFEADTGMDAAADAHHMNNHWLPRAEDD